MAWFGTTATGTISGGRARQRKGPSSGYWYYEGGKHIPIWIPSDGSGATRNPGADAWALWASGPAPEGPWRSWEPKDLWYKDLLNYGIQAFGAVAVANVLAIASAGYITETLGIAQGGPTFDFVSAALSGAEAWALTGLSDVVGDNPLGTFFDTAAYALAGRAVLSTLSGLQGLGEAVVDLAANPLVRAAVPGAVLAPVDAIKAATQIYVDVTSPPIWFGNVSLGSETLAIPPFF